MKNILIHIGRILLALYFLAPGIAKFVSWDYHVALMESHNMVMVPTLLAIAGAAQIIGSSNKVVLDKILLYKESLKTKVINASKKLKR